MDIQYLTISEAAALKGVSPSLIHEALCSGELPAVMVFRSDLVDCRLIQPLELEVWSRTSEILPARHAPAARYVR